MTNTKVKFVIVVESSNTNLRDNEIRSVSYEVLQWIRMRSDEQGFLPNSLLKLHAIRSTLTIFHESIKVSQYRQTY